MPVLGRDGWTEDDVKNLPDGEHDYFDRKSGRLISAPNFRDDLAKALSAFANSGGGHLVLGVEDDGTFSCVDAVRGRTPTREWLEQIIADLLSDPLSGFRVHEVRRSSNSAIPPGQCLIVIDIPDSPHAPHQARSSLQYYYRVGGHSKPAPHFYLEALRRRITAPVLIPTLKKAEIFGACRCLDAIVVQSWLYFTVENRGRVAANKWTIGLKPVFRSPGDADAIFPRNLPRGALKVSDPLLKQDQTLFPGITRSQVAALTMLVHCPTAERDDLVKAISSIAASVDGISCTIYSEHPPLDPKLLPIQEVLRPQDASRIQWLLPGPGSAPHAFYAGHGIELIGPRLSAPSPGSQWREFQTFIRNDSTDYLTEATVSVRFVSRSGHIMCRRSIDVKALPPHHTKEVRVSVEVQDISEEPGFDVRLIAANGYHDDGTRFTPPMIIFGDE